MGNGGSNADQREDVAARAGSGCPVTWLALKMQGGATARGAGASGRQRRLGTDSPLEPGFQPSQAVLHG